jgi:hypothetical protein
VNLDFERGYTLYIQPNGSLLRVDDPEPEEPRCAGCGLQTRLLAFNKHGIKICATCAAPIRVTIGNAIHAILSGDSIHRYDCKPNGWRPGQ